MSDVQSPLPSDDPRMIAWEKYKASDEYANTRKWALYDTHVDGSLWAAFLAGRASSSPSETAEEK